MDAVEFLKEKERMCNKCSACSRCPVDKKNSGFYMDCEDLQIENPEEFVAIIEKWSAEHPIKTRQSEFLKMFPNAPLRENGSIAICPLDVDRDAKCSQKQGARCPDCQKEYWITEVGDE